MYRGIAYYKGKRRPLSHGVTCSKREEKLSKFREKAWPQFSGNHYKKRGKSCKNQAKTFVKTTVNRM